MRHSRPPFARFQQIDRELRGHRYPNCTRLARKLEVSRKSIQRDIEFMRNMLSAPIEYDPSKKGYFYSESWLFDPSSFLNNREIAALAATSRVLAQYQGTPYYEEVSHAIDKLMQYMPIACSGDGLFDIYSFDNFVSLSGVDQDHFALVEQALRNSRKIAMTYNSSSRQAVTERIVHPYRLHYDQGGKTWYLIGFCEYRKDVRTFAICRIQRLSLTEDSFAIPASFNIEHYLQQAFNLTAGVAAYDVVIRFTPYQAQWIREHRWHPTQQIDEHENGSITLHMKVSALDAVKRWVMRYGKEAEVLEPEELREMVKDEVRKMVKLYKESTR